MLRKWDKLPEQIRIDAVRPYYDRLVKKKFSLFLKRMFDVILSAVLIVLLSPLFVIISVLIVLDSDGGIFYRQERITQYGRKFKIFKFRTMIIGADKIGTLVTIQNDNRITKLGRKLRKYRFR